ncbi:MAG TPA: MFS transporter [Thermoanaerobaculia bacterium]|nr:MFS transporter [Thermoanaerobaculia bacterium]
MSRQPRESGHSRVSPGAGRWVLAAAVLGSSLSFIDGAVVSVALPILQRELGASVSSAQWIVEAYQLFLSSLVLLGGSLADRFGRRRVFVVGTAIFAAASLACGLAPNVRLLIVARALQGLGGSLLVPASLAMLGAAFPESERGRAVGTWSALTAIATAIGPALGGWLVQAISWRAIFLINLPIAAVVAWIAMRKVKETRNPSAGGLDIAGGLLATLGFGALVFGLIEAPQAGWAHPRAWAPTAAGVVLLAAFVVVEWRSKHPMVPLGLFKSRTFSAVNVLTLFMYAALAALFFFLPFWLIQSHGYTPAASGASLLPLVVVMASLSKLSGKMAVRIGPRVFLTAGPFIAAVGFLLFAILPDGSYAVSVLPAMLVLGAGLGIAVAPLTATVLNSVDRRSQGTASGINNAIARVAGLLAIAVLGIVATGVFDRRLDAQLRAARIPEATRQQLISERGKLGALQPPKGTPEDQARAITGAVASSLDRAFRMLALGCCGLGVLSAAGGLIGIRPGARTTGGRKGA